MLTYRVHACIAGILQEPAGGHMRFMWGAWALGRRFMLVPPWLDGPDVRILSMCAYCTQGAFLCIFVCTFIYVFVFCVGGRQLRIYTCINIYKLCRCQHHVLSHLQYLPAQDPATSQARCAQVCLSASTHTHTHSCETLHTGKLWNFAHGQTCTEVYVHVLIRVCMYVNTKSCW